MSAGRNLLRVALAMVLFLAGVAGARLQGESLGLRAIFSGADVCLAGGGSGETPDGPAHRHQSCVVCAQQAADAPALPPVVAIGNWSARAAQPATGSRHEDLRPNYFSARGPPPVV